MITRRPKVAARRRTAPRSAPPPTSALAMVDPQPPSEQCFQQHLRLAITREFPAVRLWRQPAGRIRTDRGTQVECAPVGAADLTGIVEPEGWRIEVEVKGYRTPITNEQQAWGTFVRDRGGVYLLARYNADLPLDENLSVAVADLRIVVESRRARG